VLVAVPKIVGTAHRAHGLRAAANQFGRFVNC
jgi:hypothetical protein